MTAGRQREAKKKKAERGKQETGWWGETKCSESGSRLSTLSNLHGAAGLLHGLDKFSGGLCTPGYCPLNKGSSSLCKRNGSLCLFLSYVMDPFLFSRSQCSCGFLTLTSLAKLAWIQPHYSSIFISCIALICLGFLIVCLLLLVIIILFIYGLIPQRL